MSEAQIIQEILAGNGDAYKQLVDKYRQMVFRTAMGFVHSKEDAEDIVQDVFLKAYTSLAAFQGVSEFSTWIYRITLNTSINFVNKNKFKRFLVDMETAVSLLFHRATEEKNAASRIEEDERNIAVKNAIDGLNEKQRTAFVLSKYEELSQKQIADIMQLSEGAVEQLLQRAKSNLRKKLAHLS